MKPPSLYAVSLDQALSWTASACVTDRRHLFDDLEEATSTERSDKRIKPSRPASNKLNSQPEKLIAT